MSAPSTRQTPAAHYTHGHAEAVLRAHADRTIANSLAYGQACLRPGMTVLDLGCGAGTITADIAERVAPGLVIASDIHPGVLEQARDYALSRGIHNIEYLVMDGCALGLDDDSVDLAHAHQVMQHVSDPVAVLREMARVTRPGGHIAVRDGDYGAFTWHPASPGIEQWRHLYSAAARANGGEPDAGRRLLAWAHQAGLTDVTATSTTWTYPAGDPARWWGTNWANRLLNSDLTCQLTDSGLATTTELEQIAQAWLDWSEHPDAWFMAPSAEILVTM